MARDLSGEDIKVLILDGEHMAERCVVLALAIIAEALNSRHGCWMAPPRGPWRQGSHPTTHLARGADDVTEHLLDKDKAWDDAKLVRAFGHPDPEQGLRQAKDLAGLLQKNHPGAAASLREGLAEMFTVARPRIDGRLAKTLTTSNPSRNASDTETIGAVA